MQWQHGSITMNVGEIRHRGKINPIAGEIVFAGLQYIITKA